MIVAARENFHFNQMQPEGLGRPKCKQVYGSMKETLCPSGLILFVLGSSLLWRISASGKVIDSDNWDRGYRTRSQTTGYRAFRFKIDDARYAIEGGESSSGLNSQVFL